MIFSRWEEIPSIPESEHEVCFLRILENYGFGGINKVVPLKKRYTRGRAWTEIELNELFKAYNEYKSLTFIAACLNRNPQDIIYKLLDHCKELGETFTEKGRSEGSKNWNTQVRDCARDLFEEGLPCWKIAVLFQIDFEFVEKEMTIKRKLYGHDKKNPFGINSDHKQYINSIVVSQNSSMIKRAFEPFAGEGRFTEVLLKHANVQEIVAIENDIESAKIYRKQIQSPIVDFFEGDNRLFFDNNKLGHFDLIDLDPFTTCYDHLRMVWDLLNENSLLFVNFGGEYRRSFIKTNRKSIENKYGYNNMEANNQEYLEEVPFYYLGFIAKLAYEHGFCFSVIKAVRYANFCRFWLKVSKAESRCYDWYKENTIVDAYGIKYKNLLLPRFREIRKEFDVYIQSKKEYGAV